MSKETAATFTRRTELTIQFITGLAVVIGAVLVIFELRQSRAATYAQMTQDRIEFSKAHFSQIYGEKLPAALSKACFTPVEIDEEDILIIDRYFSNLIVEIYKTRALQEVGDFGVVSGGNPWKNVSATYVMEILRYPSGRAYLNKHPYYGNPENIQNDSVVKFIHSFDRNRALVECRNTGDWIIPSI